MAFPPLRVGGTRRPPTSATPWARFPATCRRLMVAPGAVRRPAVPLLSIAPRLDEAWLMLTRASSCAVYPRWSISFHEVPLHLSPRPKGWSDAAGLPRVSRERRRSGVLLFAARRSSERPRADCGSRLSLAGSHTFLVAIPGARCHLTGSACGPPTDRWRGGAAFKAAAHPTDLPLRARRVASPVWQRMARPGARVAVADPRLRLS
jgi:hypothetical protein